ncbi:MAG: deoxyribodipyrimidine photo-lyase [Chthoniobacteraceae bacterium]
MPVIHWFRRDLRITDNTALTAASRGGREVVPLYIASGWKREHRWTGPARQEFLCGCLASLAKNIDAIGGQLVIRRGEADKELERLAIEMKADTIYFNRDPDPFGREMEKRVEKMAHRLGIEVHSFKDIAIHERDEVLTGTGGPYRVFTPYANAWMKLEKPVIQPAIRKLTPPRIKSLPLPTLEDWNLKSTAQIPGTGEKAARKRLAEFLRGPILVYGVNRDIPFGKNNSCLSADLRHGTLSIREIHAKCIHLAKGETAAHRKSIFTFIKELIWREFYMQILWHFPEVLELEFNPKHRSLPWKKLGADFQRWCDGETGFPIVDAGMRQLNATGYMHNRVRMIVAMFLTKDLHIDWRHGEQYFMQKLIDGEIASNNGGWQWSAGTGADAAPYFRIQNPWSQSARFDPEGKYIKQWVPELRDTDPAKLAQAPSDNTPIAKNYPAPTLDHARERNITLEMFARDA